MAGRAAIPRPSSFPELNSARIGTLSARAPLLACQQCRTKATALCLPLGIDPLRLAWDTLLASRRGNGRMHDAFLRPLLSALCPLLGVSSRCKFKYAGTSMLISFVARCLTELRAENA